MAKKSKRLYTAREKFDAVLELLTGENAVVGKVARAYGTNPATLGLWKKEFMEHGPVVFSGSARDYEQHIWALKQEVAACQCRIVQLEGMFAEKNAETKQLEK